MGAVLNDHTDNRYDARSDASLLRSSELDDPARAAPRQREARAAVAVAVDHVADALHSRPGRPDRPQPDARLENGGRGELRRERDRAAHERLGLRGIDRDVLVPGSYEPPTTVRSLRGRT